MIQNLHPLSNNSPPRPENPNPGHPELQNQRPLIRQRTPQYYPNPRPSSARNQDIRLGKRPAPARHAESPEVNGTRPNHGDVSNYPRPKGFKKVRPDQGHPR